MDEILFKGDAMNTKIHLELDELERFMQNATADQLEKMILLLTSRKYNTIRYKMIKRLFELQRSKH